MKPVSTLLQGVALSAVLAAGSALASTVTVEIKSATGTWTSASVENSGSVGGLNSSMITWGTPVPNAGGAPSGYAFEATTPLPTISTGSEFELGMFTHANNRVTGDALLSATLRVDITFQIAGEASTRMTTSFFEFDHDETINYRRGDTFFDRDCKYGDGKPGDSGTINVEGCADRVDATTNAETSTPFTVNGHSYMLTFSGFKADGQTLGYFLTQERADNSAVITAKLEAVPLPAAGWLMIAGLGGLAAMKRRKKARADA